MLTMGSDVFMNPANIALPVELIVQSNIESLVLYSDTSLFLNT